jgi:hypothetical protein
MKGQVGVARPGQERSHGEHALNRTRTGVSILLAVFVVTIMGIQPGSLQASALVGALADELAYEGMQACVDDPFEHDDPFSFLTPTSRELNPPNRSITACSLFSLPVSIRNSQQGPLALRC